MHIPDGFISPQTYLPAYAVAGCAWVYAARRVRQALGDETVPRLAVLTALVYALSLVMLPLPGGTSAHVLGVGLLALLFGVWTAFLAYSLVLALQALLFGAGGLTALPINALAMGLAGAAAAVGVYRLLAPRHETAAVALAAWGSVTVAALLVALVLGVQPLIASAPDGTPRFFPFGLAITLPAVVLPHLLLGVAEAALTVLVWRYAKTRGWLARSGDSPPAPHAPAAQSVPNEERHG
ncbi:MAG: energy-coupling factor ABC transporter permease [Candidatus Competibacteraceae bacterium]|nr:energy-coupling factor ABC transporter permease [Candidatus Competibacteraceae bacterium]